MQGRRPNGRAPRARPNAADVESGGGRKSDQVARATDLITRVVDEVSRELFIEEATAYVQDDEDVIERHIADIARAVVRVYSDELDNVFMATLLAYMRAAEDKGARDVVVLLNVIYEQVLILMRERLPAGVQVAEVLTQIPGREDRARAMARVFAAAGGGGEADDGEGASGGGDRPEGATRVPLPPCLPSDVIAACQEMVSGMERDVDSTDRLLMLRLCAVREEARDCALRSPDAKGKAGADVISPALPRREMALLNALLRVGEAPRRRALLQEAFGKDWPRSLRSPEHYERLLRKPPSQGNGRPRGMGRGRGAGGSGGSGGSGKAKGVEARGPAKPGAFLECATSMIFELSLENNLRFLPSNAAKPNPQTLTRVREVREEALGVIRELGGMDE